MRHMELFFVCSTVCYTCMLYSVLYVYALQCAIRVCSTVCYTCMLYSVLYMYTLQCAIRVGFHTLLIVVSGTRRTRIFARRVPK